MSAPFQQQPTTNRLAPAQPGHPPKLIDQHDRAACLLTQRDHREQLDVDRGQNDAVAGVGVCAGKLAGAILIVAATGL